VRLLNLRGKSNDLFWFSFFHEAAHVLHDNKKDLYINSGEKDNPIEVRADCFAAEILIPASFNKQIKSARSKSALISLAKKIGVASGIVAGRYQHLSKNYRVFNDLKTRFDWENQGDATR
jgi:Zn-dependent peptidase ImmA (M78 family)